MKDFLEEGSLSWFSQNGELWTRVDRNAVLQTKVIIRAQK